MCTQLYVVGTADSVLIKKVSFIERVPLYTYVVPVHCSSFTEVYRVKVVLYPVL